VIVGITETCDKDIFPYLFNIRHNQMYFDPLLDVSCYAPETMQTEKREFFLAWHAEMSKNIIFNFQIEK